MRTDAAVLVAVKAVEHADRVDRAGADAGLLQEFAGRCLEHGLAQFLHAAGEAPGAAAGHRRTLHEKDAIAAADDADHADDGALGIETAHPASR
jgi:hypothetical protein